MKAFLETLSKVNIHTEKLAIARAILAFGPLLTILGNDLTYLTHTEYIRSSETVAELASQLYAYRFSIFTLFSPAAARGIAMIILGFVISGYWPRLTCFLHAWVAISITNSVIPLDGGDQIAANLTVLLIPICLTDGRTNQWIPLPTPTNPYVNVFANVALFFIQLQASIVYLHAGMGKLFADQWKDGTAMYYWVSHPLHGAPDGIRNLIELITLSKWVPYLTWLIILFEVFLFACIFANKRIKGGFLVAGILFHLSIIFVHGLVSFFFSMFALLILYLDDANRSIQVYYAVRKGVVRLVKRVLLVKHDDLEGNAVPEVERE